VMLPMQARAGTETDPGAVIDKKSVDVEKRTFDIVWTTGAEVKRIDWWTGERFVEMLEVSKEAIRLDRLQSGRAPVLNAHAHYELNDVIGVVEGDSIKIESGVGHARVRMSGREDVAPLLADIRDGIIANISCGYIVHAYREELREGVTYRIMTDWEPMEISFVPVAADGEAAKRSAPQGATYPCQVLRVPAAEPPLPAPANGQAGLARMRMRQRAIEPAKEAAK